jgi:hypothetical protein
MWGLLQISGHGSGHGKSAASLLQSKVGRDGSPDHHVSHVEAPLRAAWRLPAVLGCRDGESAVFRVDRAALWCRWSLASPRSQCPSGSSSSLLSFNHRPQRRQGLRRARLPAPECLAGCAPRRPCPTQFGRNSCRGKPPGRCGSRRSGWRHESTRGRPR